MRSKKIKRRWVLSEGSQRSDRWNRASLTSLSSNTYVLISPGHILIKS